MVVDQHQVEVGAGHHLPATGLAHRYHRHPAATHPPEAAGKIRQHRWQQRGQSGLGHRRPAFSGGVRVQPTLHGCDREVEILLLDRPPDDLNDVFQFAAVAHACAQALLRMRVILRRQQPLQRAWMLRQVIRQARRGPQHRRDPVE